MAVPIKKLTVSLIKRNAIKRGPTSSDAWNDSFEEAVNDLSRFTSQWNDSLYPLLSTLPDGTNDLDAFTDGLDGRVIYVDHSATGSVADTTYFNIGASRPNSVKEQFSDVYTTITQLQQDLENQISLAGGALTDAQKERIGANIFDALATSSPTSLDGKSENNRLNLIQLARDLYGPAFSLDNDGAANLTNSVMAMVDALLELHNGNWDNDVSLNHAGLGDFKSDGSVPMTGSLKLADGSAASPSLTFNADQDTGLFRSGSNQLAFTVGGVEQARFDGTTSALLIDKIRPRLAAGIDIDLLQPADGILNLTGWLVSTQSVSVANYFRQGLGYLANTLDGPGNIAHHFDTLVSYTGAGSKLLKVSNFGSEKFFIDKDGYTTTQGLNVNEISQVGSLAGNTKYNYTDVISNGLTRIKYTGGSTDYAFFEVDGTSNPVKVLMSARNSADLALATMVVDANGDAQIAGASGYAGVQVLNSSAGSAYNTNGVLITAIKLDATIHNELNVSEEGFLFADLITPGAVIVSIDGTLTIAKTLTTQGGQVRAVNVLTSAGPYVVVSTDHYIVVNQTVGAPMAITIPSPGNAGRSLKIKDGKGDANTNNITITPATGTIDGAASFVMTANYESIELVDNGTEWSVF